MPNVQEIEERLRQDREDLGKVDNHREALLEAIRAHERLLALAVQPTNGVVDSSLQVTEGTGEGKSGPSLMAAAQWITYTAQKPLHVKEILRRAQEMGVPTRSDNPVSAVDITMFNLSKKGLVRKTDPRTYIWIGATAPPRPLSTLVSFMGPRLPMKI